MRTRKNADLWLPLDIPYGPKANEAIQQRLTIVAVEDVYPIDELKTLTDGWEPSKFHDPKSPLSKKWMKVLKGDSEQRAKGKPLGIDDVLRTTLVVGHKLFHSELLPREVILQIDADARSLKFNSGVEPNYPAIRKWLMRVGRNMYLPALRKARAIMAAREIIAAALGPQTYPAMVSASVDYISSAAFKSWLKHIRANQVSATEDYSLFLDRKKETDLLARALRGTQQAGRKHDVNINQIIWFYQTLAYLTKNRSRDVSAFKYWCMELGLSKDQTKLLLGTERNVHEIVIGVMIDNNVITSEKTLRKAQSKMAKLVGDQGWPREARALIDSTWTDPSLICATDFWSDLHLLNATPQK